MFPAGSRPSGQKQPLLELPERDRHIAQPAPLPPRSQDNHWPFRSPCVALPFPRSSQTQGSGRPEHCAGPGTHQRLPCPARAPSSARGTRTAAHVALPVRLPT